MVTRGIRIAKTGVRFPLGPPLLRQGYEVQGLRMNKRLAFCNVCGEVSCAALPARRSLGEGGAKQGKKSPKGDFLLQNIVQGRPLYIYKGRPCCLIPS